MSDRPNILFIMPDQLRHDFLGCYGADFIRTPHIDRIATEGTRYDRAYSLHPVCVPARVSLLTGLNAMRAGVLGNGQFLRPDHDACGIQVWPQVLSQAGYFTAAIGKMHFYPWDLMLGFQHRVICEDKRWLLVQDDYAKLLAQHGLHKFHGNEHEGYYENRGAVVSRLPWELYWDRFVGEEACRFIREYDCDQPFAAMVGFPGPHCPYDPVPEFLEAFDEADLPPAVPEVEGDHPRLRQNNISGNKGPWNGVDYTEFTDAHKHKIRAHYAALVAQIDHEVGRILDALEARDMLDNTVLIFSSDHGDYLGDHNLIGKGHFFEASTHVPLLVRSPSGHLTPKGPAVRDDLAALGDVTATILGFGGCDIPRYMDARPLPGLGLAGDTPRAILVGMLSSAWMAYDGTTKLAKYGTGEALMFDMIEDPTEQHNLLRDPGHQATYRQLDAALCREIMHSANASHNEKRVSVSWDQPEFGGDTWHRAYPANLAR